MQCTSAILYCHLWPDRLCYIFAHYRINGKIFFFKKKVVKFEFWISLQLLSEIFFILRRTERDLVKNVCRSLCKVSLFVSGLNKPEILSLGRFSKSNQILKLHENPSNGNQVVPCGRTEIWWTEGQDEAKTADFRNFANAPKIRSCNSKCKIHYQ